MSLMLPSAKERKERLTAYEKDSFVSTNVNHEKARRAHHVGGDKSLHSNIGQELALYGFCLLIKAENGAIVINPDSYNLELKEKKDDSGFAWVQDPTPNSSPTVYFCFHNDVLYQWWSRSDNVDDGVWVKVRTI
jgi:hypothetical protein